MDVVLASTMKYVPAEAQLDIVANIAKFPENAMVFLSKMLHVVVSFSPDNKHQIGLKPPSPVGHGKCTAEDTCTCEGEWKGDTCSTPIPTC